MPEYYFLSKRMVRAVPALHGFARGLEGVLIRGYFSLLSRLSLASACRLGFHLFATLGRVIARRHKMIANLAVAFPDKGPAELRQLARGCFGHLGMAFAELCHLPDIWAERAERLDFVADPTVKVVRGGDLVLRSDKIEYCRGRIVDGRGQPVVTSIMLGDNAILDSTRSDAKGRFVLRAEHSLPDGPLQRPPASIQTNG